MEFVFRFPSAFFAYLYVVGNFKYVIYYDSSGKCVFMYVWVCLCIWSKSWNEWKDKWGTATVGWWDEETISKQM